LASFIHLFWNKKPLDWLIVSIYYNYNYRILVLLWYFNVFIFCW